MQAPAQASAAAAAAPAAASAFSSFFIESYKSLWSVDLISVEDEDQYTRSYSSRRREDEKRTLN